MTTAGAARGRPSRGMAAGARSLMRRPGTAATLQAYAEVIDKFIGRLGALSQLDEMTDGEIGEVLGELWGSTGESTWDRDRAAVSSWLTWCRDKKRWPAPAAPGSCERRKEHIDGTKDPAKSALERQISRRDVPLREKTLWRMLYEPDDARQRASPS